MPSSVIVSARAAVALAAGRLVRLNDDLLAYRLRRPAMDGRTEILLSPLQ
jgi:hypothetical protein